MYIYIYVKKYLDENHPPDFYVHPVFWATLTTNDEISSEFEIHPIVFHH